MDNLDSISDLIREQFDARTAARDMALSQARALTRYCSQAIRAVHRDGGDVVLHEAHTRSENLARVVDVVAPGVSAYHLEPVGEAAGHLEGHPVVSRVAPRHEPDDGREHSAGERQERAGAAATRVRPRRTASERRSMASGTAPFWRAVSFCAKRSLALVGSTARTSRT